METMPKRILQWTAVAFCVLVVLWLGGAVILIQGRTLTPDALPLSQFGLGISAFIATGGAIALVVKFFTEATIGVFHRKKQKVVETHPSHKPFETSGPRYGDGLRTCNDLVGPPDPKTGHRDVISFE